MIVRIEPRVEDRFPELPYLEEPITDRPFRLWPNNRYFDKDGFALTCLEAMFHAVNHVSTGYILNVRSVAMEWWRQPQLVEDGTPHSVLLDHAFTSVRYGYRGAALEQLQKYVLLQGNRRDLVKLATIRPKYGADFSIDYVESDTNWYELVHVEVDWLDRIRAIDETYELETRILRADWFDIAKAVAVRKDEWRHLNSDDASDWKAAFVFGAPFNRAYRTLKIQPCI